MRYVTEAEVIAALDVREAISALEEGMRAQHAGDVLNLVKTHVVWDGGSTLHALGGAAPKWGYAATKTWANTPLGSEPHLLMFDTRDGSLLAIIQASHLGQLRTGAISAVATKLLAHPDADELAVIGTGKQALSQVASLAAVRTLRHVRVYGRNADKAAAFAARLGTDLGLTASTVDTVEKAVADAPIVTLVTRAREPFLPADLPARGAHINAVGAITPERAEFAPDLLDRCDVVTTDSVGGARKLARELMDHYRDDEAAWARVVALATLVATGSARPSGADLTLFKSMGTGVSDLSLGVRCLQNIARREESTDVHTEPE